MKKRLQAKDIIRSYIKQRKAASEYRLPPERAMAEKLGFSRGTIGKALALLEEEGVIIRKPGAGTFISRDITIAVVMRAAYHYTDTFFRTVLGRIDTFAKRNHVSTRIFDRTIELFENSPDDNTLITAIRNDEVQGVLLISRMPVDIAGRISSLCPVVAVNNIYAGQSGVPCIICDYFQAGFLAAECLLHAGHRKIAFITTSSFSHYNTIATYSGFKCALRAAEIKFAKADRLDAGRNLNVITRRTLDFLKNSNYTACVVDDLSTGTQIYSIASKAGYKIPGDLSLIMIGHRLKNNRRKTNLAMIDNRMDKMCSIGIETLLEWIKSGEFPREPIVLLSPKTTSINTIHNLAKSKVRQIR